MHEVDKKLVFLSCVLASLMMINQLITIRPKGMCFTVAVMSLMHLSHLFVWFNFDQDSYFFFWRFQKLRVSTIFLVVCFCMAIFRFSFGRFALWGTFALSNFKRLCGESYTSGYVWMESRCFSSDVFAARFIDLVIIGSALCLTKVLTGAMNPLVVNNSFNNPSAAAYAPENLTMCASSFSLIASIGSRSNTTCSSTLKNTDRMALSPLC